MSDKIKVGDVFTHPECEGRYFLFTNLRRDKLHAVDLGDANTTYGAWFRTDALDEIVVLYNINKALLEVTEELMNNGD